MRHTVFTGTVVAGLLLVGCVSQPSLAADVSGEIRLLPTCPGDAPPPEATAALHLDPQVGESEAVAAVLLPLIGAVIKQGISIAGQRFKEAAQEKTVDTLHSGEYRLYQLRAQVSGEKVDLATTTIVPANRCLVVLSKSTASARTNGDLSGLVGGYRQLGTYPIPIEYGSELRSAKNYVNGEAALKKTLAGRRAPGLLAVIDIVPSKTMDSFRLEPRFVATEHSIREGSRDDKDRDFTLSFKMTAPGAKSPREMLLKFEKLNRSRPYVRSGAATLASPWQPLLPLTEAESARFRSGIDSNVRVMKSAMKVYAEVKPLVFGKREEMPEDLSGDKLIGPAYNCRFDNSEARCGRGLSAVSKSWTCFGEFTRVINRRDGRPGRRMCAKTAGCDFTNPIGQRAETSMPPNW